jgi:inner membrane protein
VVAALLPDIDLPTSKLGRVFYGLSTYLERQHGHRTLTHSAVALVALAGVLSPLLWLGHARWFWALLGGYGSHILVDMLNLRGADLLWPDPARFVIPGNRQYRIEVGSKAEMVLLVCLTGFCLLLYPVSGIGVRAGLQRLLGNFDMALEQFTQQVGTRWFTLALEATDNLTLQRIQCECPVLGVWNHGLIVLYDGQPRAVGQSQVSHNLYPNVARLLEGPGLDVVSEKVNMAGRSLGWLLGHIDKERTYYLLGELRVGSKVQDLESLELYHPASYSGSVLRLHYARAQDIQRYLGLVAAEGEIYVQYWLKEGDPPVRLAFEDKEPVSLIPEELRPFL